MTPLSHRVLDLATPCVSIFPPLSLGLPAEVAALNQEIALYCLIRTYASHALLHVTGYPVATIHKNGVYS
jgi:hypothetical protein